MSTGSNRPLSPHLFIYRLIYRPQITSFLSLIHRFTGVALVGGALVLAYWVVAAAYGPEAFDTAQWLLGSWIGILALLAFTFSAFYHLANGIRHMLWDIGFGLDMPTLELTGWIVVLFACVGTFFTWAFAMYLY